MIIIGRSRSPGAYGIIDSGSVSLPADAKSVRLELEDLKVTLEFSNRSGVGETVEILGHDAKSVKLGFINFDNPLGVAWDSPIGSYQDKDLILSLMVHTVSSPDLDRRPRVITYSFIQRIA